MTQGQLFPREQAGGVLFLHPGDHQARFLIYSLQNKEVKAALGRLCCPYQGSGFQE